MTPTPRFVARLRLASKTWVVIDDLRGRVVNVGITDQVAMFIAHSYEATWRERCQRWIEAEWRNPTL